MATRPAHLPRRDIKPKYVMEHRADWPGAQLAVQVRYAGNGKHKTQSPPSNKRGLWTPVWHDDGHAERCETYDPRDWESIELLLKHSIELGFVATDKDGRPEFRDGMPSRAWAFIDGVLHEARLTGGKTYHAFPLTVERTWPIDPHRRLDDEDVPRWTRAHGPYCREPSP